MDAVLLILSFLFTLALIIKTLFYTFNHKNVYKMILDHPLNHKRRIKKNSFTNIDYLICGGASFSWSLYTLHFVLNLRIVESIVLSTILMLTITDFVKIFIHININKLINHVTFLKARPGDTGFVCDKDNETKIYKVLIHGKTYKAKNQAKKEPEVFDNVLVKKGGGPTDFIEIQPLH